MSLHHLIYVSSARSEMEPEQLEEILEVAVRFNQASGLTGMLLYAGGSFIQVLEGEESELDETFARIARDPRHRDIYVLERKPIESRTFGQWSMGFRALGRADLAEHPGFAGVLEEGFDAARINARPGLALDILENFAATLRGR